ncbi:hypothetical protein G6F57_015548 [Rhizopus arrhizus]|uniref:Uncharacterized protein n=1 Tax=Rhizopus oryzae TaxID=64495 RepID=A0A9P7BKJ2_RHIOR|nr:hypothetical protein G6F23_013830 [Rhizopus arrhizus]KAG0743506.1 hypothetical protein G6F24_016252 [Rhizopus arrhizus]KAG0755824.1 hypothetical protein G6F22_020486 [Rhizopus arrhizus]KAG0778679.1 hypothetical protein G6F21_012882 [Rhizopus arrhizus]KAG0804456.1 hypothetical protein G6F20_012682 [Rhizopus arrhizus]
MCKISRRYSNLSFFTHCNPQDAPQLLPQLNIVEHQLASLQQYRVDTLALRAGIRWRECGELSAGYLKQTVKQNVVEQ